MGRIQTMETVGGVVTGFRPCSSRSTKGLSRYYLRSYVIVFVLFLFAFERAIIQTIPAFGYIDETLFIIAVPIVLLNFKNLTTLERYSCLCCIAILCIGLLSSLWAGIYLSPTALAVDAISCFKVIFAYFLFKSLCFEDEVVYQVLDLSARCARILACIMLIAVIASQFMHTGMLAAERYGINSFMFIFGHPGNFSKLFYFLIPLMFLDLRNGVSAWKLITIGMTLLVWCFTLRARALAFAVLTIILSAYYFSRYRKRIGIRFGAIGLILILFGLGTALAISGDKIVLYFTTDTQARYNLLHFSFVTAADYFPLGSGFGTYGSHVAAENYSPLYYEYGFDKIYGMRPEETMYLDDNYWPMILGQFGFFGLFFMAMSLCLIFAQCIRDAKHGRYEWLAAVLVIGFLLLSSVASKSYSEFSSICCFMFMALLRPLPQNRQLGNRELPAHTLAPNVTAP